MTSSAILLTAGTEQLDMHSMATAKGESNDISFAKSFANQVGDSDLMQKHLSSEKESGFVAKKQSEGTDQAAGAQLAGAKGKVITAQNPQSQSKQNKSEPTNLAESDAPVGISTPEEKAPANTLGTESTRTSEQGNTIANSSEPSSLASLPASAAPVVVPPIKPPDGLPVPLIPVEKAQAPEAHDTSATQKVADTKGQPATKKVHDSQEKTTTLKVDQIPAQEAANATSAKSAEASQHRSVVLPSGPAVGVATNQPTEFNKSSLDLSSTAAPLPKPTPPPVADGSVREQPLSTTKLSAADAAPQVAVDAVPQVAVTEDQTTPEKISAGLERSIATSPRSASESASDVQGVAGISKSSLHTASSLTGVTVNTGSADSVPGSTPQTSVAIQTGIPGSPHTGASLTASKEQYETASAKVPIDVAPRMLSSTPTTLEVGIQNGTHGWLKVRAEMTEGGLVNASVSATSTAGQEMLHRELPALTAYLQGEKIAVNALAVNPQTLHGGGLRDTPTGTDGSGGQPSQRSNEGGEQQRYSGKAAVDSSNESMTYRGLYEVNEDESLATTASISGGGWLSVRA
jgi:hypothetical protein